jgi:predicted short-subunit dehydrogenase-like oxidoreductase (DUF2520 family)
MQPPIDTPVVSRIAVVGAGRLGRALAVALSASFEVTGPLGRGADGASADAVLLCVPDGEIAAAAAALAPSAGLLVGHCSGATGLGVLAPHEAFSLHPLMAVTVAGATFAGAGAAVAGTTPAALAFATSVARTLAMEPIAVAEDDRAAYHAAASIASNFLVTLEDAAERLAATAGVRRELLLPLVRASVENWGTLGGPAALTGPLARGDEQTVRRQRDAIAARLPDLLALFDSLADRSRALAGHREPEASLR